MFRSIGKLVARGWPAVIALWLAAFAGLWLAAPEWNCVAQSGEFVFLLSDASSRRAEQILDRAFPDDRANSSIVLILHRPYGDAIREVDKEFVTDRLGPRLEKLSEELAQQSADDTADGTEAAQDSPPAGNANSPIVRIRTYASEPAGPLLVSSGDQAMLVIIELTTEFLSDRNRKIVGRVEDIVRELQQATGVPEGLAIELTGSAAVGSDVLQARKESGDAVRSWTIWIVIALLFIVYRAPLVAVVPLATLYVAVEITLSALALLAEAGYIGVFRGLEVYTTVLAYGAGVDYSLFLISRYREELLHSDDDAGALTESVARVGKAIAASAGTEIFGIAMLIFTQFGKFQQAGVSIALGLAVVFCASLTLTPSLLRLLGRFAFWPQELHPEETDKPSRFERTWARIGETLQHKPLTCALTTMLIMLPFAGVAVWKFDELSYGLIDDLPQDATSVEGIEALENYFSAGVAGPVTVLIDDDETDFATQSGIDAVASLAQDLLRQQEELNVADLRSLADPLGVTDRADEALPEATGAFVQQVIRQRAIERYVSETGEWADHLTQLEIVLSSDPFRRQSIEHLDRLEASIRKSLPSELENAEIYLSGPTASLRDLKNVAREDRRRIMMLVTSVVLVILMLVLRRIAIPIFLIVTVLFGFLTTFGVTYCVFWWLGSNSFLGLYWTVPVFLFTLLVAVGEDYNIYLITRVDEEQQRQGPVRGVAVALARTGGVISGCGVIMAGTFSSLTVGGVLESMQQLGFALAFGVLVDTFVIRPILVPAYLILINDGRLGRLGRWLGARPATTAESPEGKFGK